MNDSGPPPPPCTYLVTAGPIDGGWTPAGPPGGNVTSLLAMGQGVVLAGTGFTRGFESFELEGGTVYRSTDTARTFAKVQAFSTATVSSLVFAPASSLVYAGVGSLSGSPDDGIWTSNDRGLTFTQDNGGLFAPARVRGVAVAPGTAERIYAMVEGSAASPLNAVASLFRRDDGGTWTAAAMTNVDPNPGGPALWMAADVVDPNAVYLADGARFYASTNAGDTFTPYPLFGDAGQLHEVSGLFTDPADAKHLLLGTLDNGIYESVDQGVTFNQAGIPFVGSRAALIAGGRTLIGTDSQGLLIRSGSSYGAATACPPMPAVRAIAVAPEDAGTVFIGTVGGGVLSSTDGARTFSVQATGISELLGEVVVTGSAAAPVVWVLSPAGLFKSSDRGTTWTRLPIPGPALPLSALAIDPADPNHLLLATDQDLYEAGGTGVGVFQYFLSSGVTQPSTGLPGDAVAALAFDATGHLFAYQRQPLVSTIYPNGLFVSTNAGASFSATALQSLNVDLSSFRTAPLAVAADGTVYAGVNDKMTGAGSVWRSTDHGASYQTAWQATNTGPDGGVVAQYLASGIYLGDGSVYLPGRNNGIWLLVSTDAGFVDAGAGLSGLGTIAEGMAFDPDGGILLATWGGVFWAPDAIDFVDFNQGFPATPPTIFRVAVVPGSPPTVFAVTNNGMFRRQLR